MCANRYFSNALVELPDGCGAADCGVGLRDMTVVPGDKHPLLMLGSQGGGCARIRMRAVRRSVEEADPGPTGVD